MEKAKVYFIKDITPENIIKAYDILGKILPGKVAVKMHSGEKGNKNYLKPEFVKDIVEHVNGTVVECNTAYEGARNSTEKHKQLIKEHEWDKYFPFDLLDEEGPDMELDIPNGKVLKKNYVGKKLANYDSLLVLSHFKGNTVYINIMKNISVDCDCDGNASAPCMKDIGILASLDPIAIDQACLDLVYNSTDLGKDKLINRIESRHGVHTIEASAELGFGTREYELIDIA